MSRSRWCAALALAGLGAAGCGGPKMLEIRPITEQKQVMVGPTATPEEISGEVPALRPLLGARPLVPDEMVPPEPPADPVPVFD